MDSPLIGQVIDGRYEVRSLIARGGMATVYEALDIRLDRTIALKIMHPHLAHDEAFVARFEREAKAAARLTHGHVVGVYDQGRDGENVYLAMELVRGRTLRDILRQYGPLTPEQAMVFLDPILEALAAAHAAGFVHRDIKPENVLVSHDGRVKVADFGLARALSSGTQSVTQGMIIGTVAYLSPEQVEKGEADGRSDLYAAGILLFEMVTGQVPHEGESPLSIAYQHVNSDVPPPSSLRPGLPAEVDALVVTATRRDPAQRYQSAQDFLADARRVRAMLPAPRPFNEARPTLVVSTNSGSSSTQSAQPEPSMPPTPPATPTSFMPSAHRRRSKAPVIIVLVLACVAAAAIGGWYMATHLSSTVPTPNVIGLNVDQARQQLASSGLSLTVGGEAFSETIPPQSIVSSDPMAGAGVREAGTIDVIVSKGPERYAVPDVRGQTQAAATSALDAAHLIVGSVTEDYDDKAAAGTVARSTPKAGTSAKPGAAVDLVISTGPKPVAVPDVTGRKLGNANRTLASAGLTSTTASEQYSETAKAGVVLSQNPRPGTTVNSGTAVSIVVSKGPPPVTVPKLIDMPTARAVATLKKLGLVPRVLKGAATPLNRVYSQDPAPNTDVPKGSTVTIRII
ncbi:MAG: Stk1 family PASTA domain-containing Ser/Thr kinase [Actinomycetes bacterium]